LIFDMDDTLIGSRETWERAERRFCRMLGQAYDEQLAARYKGCNARDVARAIHAHFQPVGFSMEECEQHFRQMLCEEFRGPLTAMPGVDALLRATAGHYPLAIASGSPRAVIGEILARQQWTSLFSLFVSSEEVARGKPEPDVLLETAARFGCPASACLVFEDSLNGVRAARRAGMRCFVLPSSADPRIVSEADCAFTSWEEVSLQTIENVFSCC
jgi:HAD superfamily hydrolase (TIGR01509 family)